MQVAPDDVVKAIGLLEPEAKILSEELSNSVGKQIIQMLASTELTTSELAKKLNTSIQSVAYHIKRLLDAGIVSVASREISSRGKITKRYSLKRAAFLLVVEPQTENRKQYLDKLKKIALRKFFERLLLSAMGFVSFSLFSYWLFQFLTKRNYALQFSDPTIVISPLLPDTTQMDIQVLLFSLAIGTLTSITIWHMCAKKLIRVATYMHDRST
ncbi:MAG: winged helix-turn-helix domain-containing protein [Candidatus Bathyarchaeota archaeon]|nr:winged helix-turn-helix domain-containing protein [Candidatus Bathyarchaeota archaeon]